MSSANDETLIMLLTLLRSSTTYFSFHVTHLSAYFSTLSLSLRPSSLFLSFSLTIYIYSSGSCSLMFTGSPLLYFGDGQCSANAISETDLANYLVDCALDPADQDMLNQTRDIGAVEESHYFTSY